MVFTRAAHWKHIYMYIVCSQIDLHKPYVSRNEWKTKKRWVSVGKRTELKVVANRRREVSLKGFRPSWKFNHLNDKNGPYSLRFYIIAIKLYMPNIVNIFFYNFYTIDRVGSRLALLDFDWSVVFEARFIIVL